MIARKSNIPALSESAPTFHALAWLTDPENRRMVFVTLDRDRESLVALLQQELTIDGAVYFSMDVRAFGPGPYFKGDTIRIVVSG